MISKPAELKVAKMWKKDNTQIHPLYLFDFTENL